MTRWGSRSGGSKRGSVSTQIAVSAGGVVYRSGRHGVEVVLCGRKREGLWALPKGTPEEGETLEHTALREVQEETGLEVAIERAIGSIHYQFTDTDGSLRDKRVEHYLMTPAGGHIDGHDHEFDIVRWVPVEEALRLMRYPNERDIVRQAMRLLSEREGR